jgi:hypothetical protein
LEKIFERNFFMKTPKIEIAAVLIIFALSCQEKEIQENNFTGNEITHQLIQSSDYDISGIITFKERLDKSTLVEIQLEGTQGNIYHPVHLHLGDINTPDADIAALLTPVYGENGKSETLLTSLANESKISYQDILQLDASVKIHLAAEGLDSQIILAVANIGSNGTELAKDGVGDRVFIPVCKTN